MKNTLEILQYEKLKKLIEKHLQTSYGKEKLKKLKPVFDITKAKNIYTIQNKFFSYFIKWGSITLDDIYISDIIEESYISILDEKQLKKIGDFLHQLNQIENQFLECDRELYEEHLSFDVPFHLFEEITKCIDEHGFLKDTASAHLFNIREEKKAVSQNINRVLKNMMHSRLKDIVIDTTIFLKRTRFTLLLKPNFKEFISGRIIDVGKSGGLFVEPDAVYNLNNQLEDLTSKEELERRRILKNITQMVRDNINRLKYNEQKIAQLDIYLAKFFYSKHLPECEIIFKEKPTFYAKSAKHPILASIKEDTKPVDIDLKNNSSLVVTGPNTGGKTVFLKTIGLTILSVFSGIPVNAKEVEIGNFDNVFAVIGDEQDIFESLSGFSSKIESFKKSYEQATKNSIILLDEIGSGTSPDEGEAVAYAIIKKTQEKCTVCATTHYKRLAYFLQSKGFPLAAFEFNTETLLPTYKLIYGKVGKSYGIDILKSLKIEKEIIELASEYYSKNETIMSQLEKELQKTIELYQKKKNELDKIKGKYRELIEKEKEQKNKLLRELEEEHSKKQEEYEELLKQLQLEISNVMRTKNTSKAHKKINEIKEKSKEVFELKRDKEEKNNELYEGCLIEFRGEKGKLIKLKNRKAIVEIEGKLLEVPTHLLKKTNKEERKNEIKVHSPKSSSTFELILIGKRRDEAQFELIRFIDSLVLDNIKHARIVHGFGNGILKDMVRETLKELPHIKSFRPAPPQEGGDGATIVELK